MNTISATFPDYQSLLFPIAYNMVGDAADAEDLVQETLLKWLSMEADHIENPRGYLVRTLINKCLNFLRSRKRLHTEPDHPLQASPASEMSGMLKDRHHVSLGLLALLEKLSPQERAVFMLKEVFDYSHKEIADILNISEAYCRQILRRARKHLKADRIRYDIEDSEHQEWLERFVEVSEGGDIRELLSLIQRDIRVEPAASIVHGNTAWEVAEQFLEFVENGGDLRITGKGRNAVLGMYEHDRPRAWLMLRPRKYMLAEIRVFDPFVMPPLPYAYMPFC